MIGEAFVDTNIWVYAHMDEDDNVKVRKVTVLVEAGPRYVISTQILNEYYATMIRHRVRESLIQDNLERMIRHSHVHILTLPVIRQAHGLRVKYGFSYWDCLMLASALDAGCTVLYTEDLQHGQWIADSLRIINPFLEDETLPA